MNFRLEVFEERCTACGTSFPALHQSSDDYGGPIVLVTQSLHVRGVSPEHDPVWNEADKLMARAAKRPLRDSEVASCFPLIFNDTVDSLHGERLYMWGMIACPCCGALERSSKVRKVPYEYVDISAEPVTHVEWNRLSESEKERRVELALSECMSKIQGWWVAGGHPAG